MVLESENQEEDYALYWFREGYQHIVFFSILCMIMFIWRPTQNNSRCTCRCCCSWHRFAYTPLDNVDEEEEYTVPTVAGVSRALTF